MMRILVICIFIAAVAAPIPAQEPTLQQILDAYYGKDVVNVVRDRLEQETFKVVNDQGMISCIIARFSLYDGSPFGWYNPTNPNEFRFVHPGGDVGVTRTWAVPGKQVLGFALSLDQIRPTYYTEHFRNRNAESRCFALRHPKIENTVVLCWEDWTDWDYQDCVVEITGLEVPPPSSGKKPTPGSGSSGAKPGTVKKSVR